MRVFEQLPIAVFVKDPSDDYRFVLWNQVAEETFSLKANQTLGKTDFDFFPPEQAEFFRKTDERIISTGETQLIEKEPVTTPELGVRYVRTRKIKFKCPETGKAYLLGVTEDISDVLIAKERLGFVLKTAGMGLWEWNIRKNELKWDASLHELYGTDAQTFVPDAESWRNFLVDESEHKRALDVMEDAMKKGDPFKVRFKIRRKDGEIRTLTSAAYMEKDPQGEIFRMNGINTDITEEQQIADSLVESHRQWLKMREQEAKMIHSAHLASLGEMAAGISHEINNPLSIISGMAELSLNKVKQGVMDKELLIEALDKIRTTADRISGIIRTMRSLSRMSDSEGLSNVKLHDLVYECVGFNRDRINKYSVRYSIEIPPDFAIQARSTQLTQVFANLFRNAVDAIKDLPERWIRVELVNEPNQVILKVIDSGKGIPAEIAGRIMEPFFTTKRAYGTGLGLSISRAIARKHGGDLTYEPTDPSGNTAFWLTLPKNIVNSNT